MLNKYLTTTKDIYDGRHDILFLFSFSLFVTFFLSRIVLLITMAKKKIGRPTQPFTPASPAKTDWMNITRTFPQFPKTCPPGMPQKFFTALRETDYLPDLLMSFEKYGLNDPTMPREEKEWKMRTVLKIRADCARKRAGSSPSLQSPAAIHVSFPPV